MNNLQWIEKVNILGVNICNLTLNKSLLKVKDFLDDNKMHIISTPNSEIIMAAQNNSLLMTHLNEASLAVADGAGVVIASRIIGKPLKERVAGFDLISLMFEDPDIKKNRFFLLGTKEDIIKSAANKLIEKGVNICGYRNGYFKRDDEKSIVDNINNSQTDILLVALGAPLQELFIERNKELLNVKICIGVGGSFDVIAGVSKRAPLFFQKNNLEWFYRLCNEPSRFVRMLSLPKFLIYVIFSKFGLSKVKT
jgi:N-acetylglucosaminyldiphosphoundecaprenol N-acetyl-beta-D-mannosaminyltransferase